MAYTTSAGTHYVSDFDIARSCGLRATPAVGHTHGDSGVLRGYGSDMRRWLGRSLHRRMKAFLAGLVVTALLQSSTATALMATSFASSGFIDLASGLSVMLGANVGTTLIVQVLSFNLSARNSSNRKARSIRIYRTLRQPWRGVSTCRCAGDSAQHAGENQLVQRKDSVPIRDSRQPDRIEYCRLPDR